jgi:hypothetical protein
MTIERDSVHFRILERLCAMPRPVRGIAGAMLERHFGAPDAVEELARLGLIRGRGWTNGPGMIWVPTAEGEAVCRELADGGPEHAAPEAIAPQAGSPAPWTGDRGKASSASPRRNLSEPEINTMESLTD